LRVFSPRRWKEFKEKLRPWVGSAFPAPPLRSGFGNAEPAAFLADLGAGLEAACLAKTERHKDVSGYNGL